MMFGYFIISELTGTKDSAGYFTQAKVKNKMNENIQGVLYLPPYLRQGQSNIDANCIVVGLLDEVTGLGFAVCGLDDADFQYFFDADINIKKTLSVNDAVTMDKTLDVTGKATLSDALDVTKDITSSTGNITATVGDFEATAGDFKVNTPNPLSLSLHVHATAEPGTPSTPIAPPTP